MIRAGDMEKEVLWTDLVGDIQVGPKGVHWELRDTHLRHWSLQVHRKDNESPLKLTFAYRVDKSWIPNPGNAITSAAIGDSDRLNVSVVEGLETRILSIDCKRHRFHMEPFTQSISTLPTADKEDMERVMGSGISKKAINFILEAIGDINAREAAEKEVLKKQKKKQAETLLASRNDGGNKKTQKKQRPGEESVGGARETSKKSKNVSGDIGPLARTLNPTPILENNPEETTGLRKPAATKRTTDEPRKTKAKRMKATDDTDETPLVLTAAEKGRVIAHGEEPSLEEAAADRKKFVQLFGHLYPFGVEKVFHVHIKKMMQAKSYQVTRPLDEAGVALMKNYLIQTPPAWPHHNLCLMPKLNKGERWREGMTWDDIKNGNFIIINGQHSVAASREIIAHKDTEQALKDKLKTWPCTIVWSEDPSMTVRLSYTLNNSNSFNKFTPTWTTQIMYCRRVWVKLGRPQKQRVNKAEATLDPKMMEAWKVSMHIHTMHFLTPSLQSHSHVLKGGSSRPRGTSHVFLKASHEVKGSLMKSSREVPLAREEPPLRTS